MTAVGYISDTEKLVEASRSLFHHDGVAAFKLSEKSPVPPALSAKDLPAGRTQILNVHRIKWIDHHPPERDRDRLPGSILETKSWLNRTGDLDNPNDSADDWREDNESDMELDNGSEKSETPELRNVSDGRNVPQLIRPIVRSKKMVEKALRTVNKMETMRNEGIKKK